MSDDVVLCVNCGSSSVKAALVAPDPEVGPDAGPTDMRRLASVHVDGIGTEHPAVAVDGGHRRSVDAADHGDAVGVVLEVLAEADHPYPTAAGHRLVHGGPDLVEPIILDEPVVTRLDGVVPFAPLHLPAELAAVRRLAEVRPDLTQVGCFDTAFHAGLPEAATRLPLPGWVADAGVRRYGFHGLSYEWLLARLGADHLGRAVLAHLGNGASLAAVDHGRPVDTTMGLTPTGGLVMGTRTGDLDPGVLVHLLRTTDLGVEGVADLVDRRSGLLGLSGTSSDVRDLLAARNHDADAALALDVLCRQAAKHVAAMTASLDGIDSLVFTGGIGEHEPQVRAGIARHLEHLGVVIDPDRNAEVPADGAISPHGTAVEVLVAPTDEEAVVAHHTLDLVGR